MTKSTAAIGLIIPSVGVTIRRIPQHGALRLAHCLLGDGRSPASGDGAFLPLSSEDTLRVGGACALRLRDGRSPGFSDRMSKNSWHTTHSLLRNCHQRSMW
ncbi:hypothetical protein SD81_004360 [Tolypothrix campylonemoides VB511288]|nr:hypothetical protein SD81_004360 [Tolypothrix campylonemoides VB511288]